MGPQGTGSWDSGALPVSGGWEGVPHLGGDVPAGVRGAAVEGACLIRTPANLGGGLPASVPSGIETALGWPGGCDSVDFGPGTTSPTGNVGPPSGFPGLPSSLLLTPPQLLMLNLEGVAGSDSGRGGPGEHIWTWVVARLPCLNSASLLAFPPGTLGSPFSLSLWL